MEHKSKNRTLRERMEDCRKNGKSLAKRTDEG